ncbi:MAG: sugar phosphate isomerase/epimerase family protein [Syntrophales bacterium]|nr:sugar phosphate isomerase/epimerase family protein [Syntrophales bacterium]
MHDILKRVQVHIPFNILRDKLLPTVIREGINPEIGFNYAVLDQVRREDFLRVADSLREAGLTITFHAPFMDLRPGAIDPRIRQVTRDRLRQVFDLVPFFRPRSVVCHPSFDERYYVSGEQMWLENSTETWEHFLTLAREMDTIITLENVYETGPHHLTLLLDTFTSNNHIRFCFDTGHFNVFSRMPLEVWIDKLAPCLGQIHLHDNNGVTDDHLPVGEGNFPFQSLFKMLQERDLDPIITLESHSEKDMWQMLRNIKAMGLLGGDRGRDIKVREKL